RKGTEYLLENRLFQVCFDLRSDGSNHDQIGKFIQMRLAKEVMSKIIFLSLTRRKIYCSQRNPKKVHFGAFLSDGLNQ
ncbi:MAG: hypothetical protein ACK56F_25615, partial [bacterium]